MIMKLIRLFTVVSVFMLLCVSNSCSEDNSAPDKKYELVLGDLIDQEATARTKNLYSNLWNLMEKGTMFGAQIPTMYGLDNNEKWFDLDGSASNSDTKFLVGSHPAVCGWELSGLEVSHNENIDGEKFSDIRIHIKAAFKRGAVNTISWHCNNPVSGGNSWDKTVAVKHIIPGGSHHELFKSYLDRIAEFILTLTSDDGDLIPLIFRPWHEHTGSGFWWGKGNATQAEYVALWRFTVEYLRDEKGLHNLIWAYSPDMVHISSRSDYIEFWPGDDYVDILGLDAYDRDGSNYGHKVLQLVRLGNVIAREKHKMFALTETGLENNNPLESKYYNKEWWTSMLYHVIKGQRVSFVLVWRNGDLPKNGGHYFNAFRGCYSADDFVAFTKYQDVLLENDLPAMYE